MAVLKIKKNGEWVAVGTGTQGPKGDKGNTGATGHTPVKGTDYWTDADKNEMVADVKASLTPTDIGAAASSHNQGASTITAGTFAGQVAANSSGQNPGTSLLRNSKLVSAEENPTYDGEIVWHYI